MIKFLIGCFIFIAIPSIGIATIGDNPVMMIETGGHQAKINDLIFTRDGRYIVSASDDKTIRIWDNSSGETVKVFRSQIGNGNEGKIFAVALTPDNNLLAFGGYLANLSKDGKINENEEYCKIKIIDFQSGRTTAILRGHDNVIQDLSFSHDGELLISGSADKNARIWDFASQSTIHVLKGHTDNIYAVSFSPDDSLAVTGSDDGNIKLWDVNTGELIKTVKGHKDKVRSVVFSNDGKFIVSGSFDKTIRMWDQKTGTFLEEFASLQNRIPALSISSDNSFLLVGNGGQYDPFTCFTYSTLTNRQIASFSKHTNIVRATAISPGGKMAATGGGSDYEIYLWDAKTGTERIKMCGKGKSVWSVGFAKDGRSIAWGNKYEIENPFSYGPVEQSFRIKENHGKYQLTIGEEISHNAGYIRSIKAVGKWSVETKNKKIHDSLIVFKKNKFSYEIKRDKTSGLDHRSVTITPDGRKIISGGAWGYLASYDIETGKVDHEFVGHTSDVWAVAASSDSQWLVTGSADQTIKLWDLNNGNLLLTIFHGDNNEWVAWIPEGYYAASLRGDRYVGWHINQEENESAEYYSASKFEGRFYQPQIVSNYIATRGNLNKAITMANALKPLRKKIKQTTISEIKNIIPPKVNFEIPSKRDVTVRKNHIHIKAYAKSVNNEPISNIWVLLNGKRIENYRGIVIKNKTNKTINELDAKIEATISLTQARNKISVIASNEFTQSEPEIINVRWILGPEAENEQELFKPDLYLLSIGISEYKDPKYNLGFADNDANSIASVLVKQEGKLFGKIYQKLLTNSLATRDNILDGLDWILRESTQKDVSIIFIAGHGVMDEVKNYYFLPYDHDSDLSLLRRTGVKWFDFQDVLSMLPSKVILMADTCHSGNITGKRRGFDNIIEALRELVNSENGVVVLTASTGKEVSLENPEWGHGAFTKAILEGLEGKANYNDDNIIDIKEIDLYITNRVKELTKGSQHPTTEIPKTLPNFPVVFF